MSLAATWRAAPVELTAPVLRISPHLDTSAEDLAAFAEALVAAAIVA